MKIDKEKKEYVKFQLYDFIRENKLEFNERELSALLEFSEYMLEMVCANGQYHLGVAGWLQWKYACLLERFFQESKKHNGKRISEVPELKSISNDICEFLAFTKKHLGFEEKDGGFVEINENLNENEKWKR